MSEFIHLVGADDVRNAASRIALAADTMRHAASSLAFAFETHQRFLDDWLMRFEDVLTKDREDRSCH